MIKIGSDSVTPGNGAFTNCKNLESVTLPNTLRDIQYETFKSCVVLKAIISNRLKGILFSDSPFGTSISNYVGRNTYEQGINVLYVPTGAILMMWVTGLTLFVIQGNAALQSVILYKSNIMFVKGNIVYADAET